MFKSIKLLVVSFVVSFLIIPNLASAQSVGDVAPDQSSNGCTDLSYNLTYKKSKDANTNGEVSDLQYFLQDQGLLKVDPNGIFGPSTLRAVQGFQKANGLISSGYVGPYTRAEIKSVSCNGSNTPVPTVSSTDNNNTPFITNIPSVSNYATTTVEIIGTPTLRLQYDYSGKESVLVGSATVRISTGVLPITLYQTSVPNILQFNNTSGATYSNSMTFNAASSLGDGTSGVTIPANTSVVFTIKNTVKASDLFGGTYTLRPAGFSYLDANGGYQTLQYTSYNGPTVSNSVTIVGETSPYITGVFPNTKVYTSSFLSYTNNQISQYMIQGSRFDSNSNKVMINGITKVLSATLGSVSMILFNPSDFGITNQGTYVVQVTTKDGASNNFSFNLSSLPTTVSNTSPSVVITEKPVLKLQYDSYNKESTLNSLFSVKVTAGANDMMIAKPDNGGIPTGTYYFTANLDRNINYSGEKTSITYTTAVDYGSYYLIKAGQSAMFNINKTFTPSRMFAGSYAVQLSLYPNISGDVKSFVNFAMTNSVTVIGENATQVTTPPTVNTTSVSAVVTSGPSVALNYDYLNKEASLLTNAIVTVTAGNTDLMVLKPGVSWSASRPTYAYFAMSAIDSTGTHSGVSSENPIVSSSMASSYDYGDYWLIPAGKSGEFKINQKFDIKKMFAGSYHAVPHLYMTSSNQTGDVMLTKDGNSVTIVGETSPYISGATYNNGYTTITGSRLNLPGNYLQIDGMGNSMVSKYGPTDSTISISESNFNLFAGISAGFHTVQITNAQTGNSNSFGLNVSSTQATPPVVAKPKTTVVISGGTVSSKVGVVSSGSKNVLLGNYVITTGSNGSATLSKFRFTVRAVGGSDWSKAATDLTNLKVTATGDVVYPVSTISSGLYSIYEVTFPPLTIGVNTIVNLSVTADVTGSRGGSVDLWSNQSDFSFVDDNSGTSILPTSPNSTDGNNYYWSGYISVSAGSVSPVVTQTPTAVLAKTSGFVSQNISPNTSNVKIGSFVVQNTSSETISTATTTVNLNFSGNSSNVVSNLFLRDGNNNVVIGTPIGNPVYGSNIFTFPAMNIPAGAYKTLDVYADLGNVTSGSVMANMTIYFVGNISNKSNVITADGVPITFAVATLNNPVLTQNSPASQNVLGGSMFNIATFRLATVVGSAVVRELHFNTTGTDAIISMTVNGVVVPVINNTATVTGLNIPVSSVGTDISVAVQFSGFQNSSTGGSLTSDVSNVGVTLNYIEAVSGAGSVITKQTSVSSNPMKLVSSLAPQTSGPVNVSLNVSPTTVPSGGTVSVNWSSTNANYCTLTTGSIDDYGAGSAPVSGLKIVPNVTSNRTVTLTCNGARGSSNTSAVINVVPVVVSTGSPSTDPTFTYSIVTNADQSQTVSWSTTNTSSLSFVCSSSLGGTRNGDVPTQMSTTTTPWDVLIAGGWKGTYDCTYKATGPTGIMKYFPVTFTINPKVSSLTTSPQVLGAFASNNSCVDLPRNIIRGTESSSVTKLQNFLITKGYLEAPATGIYLDKTVEAVKDYQGSKGLPVTGMVYDFTRASIKSDTCQ